MNRCALPMPLLRFHHSASRLYCHSLKDDLNNWIHHQLSIALPLLRYNVLVQFLCIYIDANSCSLHQRISIFSSSLYRYSCVSWTDCRVNLLVLHLTNIFGHCFCFVQSVFKILRMNLNVHYHVCSSWSLMLRYLYYSQVTEIYNPPFSSSSSSSLRVEILFTQRDITVVILTIIIIDIIAGLSPKLRDFLIILICTKVKVLSAC